MEKQEWEKMKDEWKGVEDKLTNLVADTDNQELMDTLLDWFNIRNKLNQGYADFMDAQMKKLPSPIFTGKELDLAAYLMACAKDEFSNHGCNDMEESAWHKWTKEERQKFVKEYYEWNGSPDEYDPNNLDLPDFAIFGFLSYKLGLQAERFNKK